MFVNEPPPPNTTQDKWRRYAAAFVAYLAIFFVQINDGYAQRHAHNWVFGENCRVEWAADGQTFTTSTSNINVREGAASFSDPQTGNLVLYTNGEKVWRGDGTEILSTLGGNDDAMHTGIVPAPGMPSHAYAFGTQIGNSSLMYYHLFDFSSGTAVPVGTRGTINFPVQSVEGLASTPHSNGVDHWIFRRAQNGVIVTPLTSAGFGTPTFYPGQTSTSPNIVSYLTGMIAISHDGTKLAHAARGGNIGIFDFDPSTGVLSNHNAITPNGVPAFGHYDGQFSPDNTKLYYPISQYGIVQYDLNNNTFTRIGTSSGSTFDPGAIRLAADGKLYVSRGDLRSTSLGMIDNPNAAGPAVNYNPTAVPMAPGCVTWIGLPQTISPLAKVTTIGSFDNLDGNLPCNITPAGTINAPDGTVVTVNVEDSGGNPVASCTGTSTNYTFTCTSAIDLTTTDTFRFVGSYTHNATTYTFEQTTSPLTCGAVCGDGARQGTEVCDDGNTTNGDGCDSTCVIENGFTCPTEGGPCLTVSVTSPVINNVYASEPPYTGTGTPNAQVNIEIKDSNGTVVQTTTATVDNNGNWSIPPQNLPEGAYTFEASVTTSGGPQTDIVPFSIDTTPPSLTLDTPTNNTTTNDDTPNIGGTTEPDATVVVIVRDNNGNVVQTLNAPVDPQGNYNVEPGALPDGTYTIEATATDPVGNTSPVVGPRTITIDGTAPTVSLVTPANNTTTNDNTLTISGVVEVGANLEVEVQDAQGNPIASLTPMVDAQGNYTIDTNALPDGDYQIVAKATDTAGNSTTTAPNTVTIDTGIPTVTLTAPSDASFTNDDTPTIEGTAEVDSTVVVLIKDDQGNVVETLNPVVDAQGDWSIDANTLPEGTYTVEATATDAAGNTSPVAGPNTFEVDLTAPSVVISSPADGSASADARPGFAGTTDAGSQVDLVLKDAQGNTIHTTSVTADAATGAWSVDDLSSDLVDGTYTIEATSTDFAGNTGTTSNGFTIDTTALPLTIDAPTAGQALNDNTPDVTGTTAPNTTVTLTITDDQGNTVQTTSVTSDPQGDYTTALNTLADGDYTITAQVTNQAGTTSTQTASFTIDTMAPMLSLDGPADGTTTNDDTPNINGTSEPGVDVLVEITDPNGNIIQTLTPTVDPMGGWNIDPNALPEGDYLITVTATDDAGNPSSDGPVSINIDLTPPSLAITGPTMGQLVSERDVDVSGTSEPNQPMITVEILDVNGVVIDTQTVDADANGDWTVQTLGLPNGDYTVQAKTADEAGNETIQTTTFSVDSDEPLITITTPTDDTTTNQARPNINGEADADATVNVVVRDGTGNEVANAQPMVDAMGNWTVMLDSDLADGTYTIEATSTRPNGKMASTSVEVTIDTMPPTTTITSPADGMVGNMNQPDINGTSEPDAEVVVTITDDMGNITETLTTTADDMGNWSVTPTNPLADGPYTINADAKDGADNMASAEPVVITIDNQTPNVQITSPTEGESINTSTPTITGTSEPNTTVEIFVDGEKIGETTTGDDGMWTFTIPENQALEEDEHTIEAQSIDPAGNRGFSGQVTINIDLASPPTIDSPTQGTSVDGPNVTASGTGEPGDELEVTIGDETQTVTVGEDGSWSATFDNVPEGPTTIEVTSNNKKATVNFNVNSPKTFILQGSGGCSTTPNQPTSKLWLFVLVGLLLVRRRTTFE